MRVGDLSAKQIKSLKDRHMLEAGIANGILRCQGECEPSDHGPVCVEPCDFVSVTFADSCPTHGKTLA